MFQILIVDDTKSVHAFVKNLLSKSKEIVTTDVFNGLEAVELLKSGKTFDLMLLDWEMPVLNGPETLRKLTGLGLVPPTVMMTTKNAPEDIVSMLELGAAQYLMKPFTVDILFEKIERVAGRSLPYAA